MDHAITPRIDELNERNVIVEKDTRTGKLIVKLLRKNGQKGKLCILFSNMIMGEWRPSKFGGWSCVLAPSKEDMKHVENFQEIIRRKALALVEDETEQKMEELQLKSWQLFPARRVPANKLEEYQQNHPGETHYPHSRFVNADNVTKGNVEGVENPPKIVITDANGSPIPFMEFKEWNRKVMPKVSVMITDLYHAKNNGVYRSNVKFVKGESRELPYGTIDRENDSETKEQKQPVTSVPPSSNAPNTSEGGGYQSQVGSKRSAAQANNKNVSPNKKSKKAVRN